jgi:hypothetical protein
LFRLHGGSGLSCLAPLQERGKDNANNDAVKRYVPSHQTAAMRRMKAKKKNAAAIRLSIVDPLST